jgi:hypothetical protein
MIGKYRIVKKNTVTRITVLVVLCILGIIVFGESSLLNKELKIYFTFLINGVIWLVLLLAEIKKRAYSMEMMHWFFCLFFFSFAPAVQYSIGIFPWIYERTEDILFSANIYLLIWTIVVLIGKYLFKHKKNRKVTMPNYEDWADYKRILPWITVINILNCANRLRTVGITNMLSRATNSDINYSSYGSLSMMISQIFQAFAYFGVVLSIVKFKKNNMSILLLGINTICLLLSYFPTGLARYAAAAIYMSMMLITFRKLKTNRYFIVVFLGAFSIILPFLNIFRTNSFFDVNILETFKSIVSDIVGNWVQWDYDAYTIFTLSIENVEKYGVGGLHILSIILFWVPRAIWTTKPLAGSYEMAHDRGLAFDNISMPLPAEGMMDWGVAGLIVFGIFVGYIMALMDDAYWANLDFLEKYVRPIDILYPVLVIFWFFMCRGDMLYIFPYMAAYIITWWIIVRLSKVLSHIKII